METIKPKRFSFAGFSSGLSRSLSFSNGVKSAKPDEKTPQPQAVDEEQKKLKRAQKSKSLYIKSFNKKTPDTPTYDVSEAAQTNGKEIRNTIRRSLSAVLYASPHSTMEDGSNKLVPVLVTPGLSESVGGILIDDGTRNKVTSEKTKEQIKPKKKSVEYDNTLIVEEEGNKTTIIWQAYGYSFTKQDQEEVSSELLMKDLELRFEKEVWESYRGLIHPLHLFEEMSHTEEILNRGRWAGLTVTELRGYYDNYGSMMLKIRENRMREQQEKYQTSTQVNNEWIIPITNQNQDITV